MNRHPSKVIAILTAMASIAILLILGTVEASDIIQFKGTSTAADGTPLSLTGKITKPQGSGPFPAIVLLHECAGITPFQDAWAERFADWGYVAIQVDSFGPRGITSICADLDLILSLVSARTKDAYDAKCYLAGLPFIDRNRIGVMGWSHGGNTVLSVVDQKRDDPFQVAIAFYPYCSRMLFGFNAPLLILIGEEDDWTPASMCTLRLRPTQSGHEVMMKVYPGAHHGFDFHGLDILATGHDGGHRMLYHPVAAADAVQQVKQFLTKHLK